MSDYWKKRMEELGLGNTSSSNSNEATQNSGASNSSSQTTTQPTSNNGSYWSDRIKALGIEIDIPDVDENYINQFMQDTNNFFSQSQTDWDAMSWGSATDWDSKNTRKDTWRDLTYRMGKIREYAEAYRYDMGEDAYTQLTSYLDEVEESGNGIVDSFNNAYTHYSQWESQEHYDATNMSVDDYKSKVDGIEDAENDLDIIWQVNQTLVPIDGYGENATEEEKQKHQDYINKLTVLWEKYGKDQYDSVEAFYYGEFYTDAGVRVSKQAEERANQIAYTTKDGTNITWQDLYDNAAYDQGVQQDYELYSSNEDWAVNSQAIKYYDDTASDYSIVYAVLTSNMPVDKEHALESGYSEEQYNDLQRKREYVQNKYGSQYGLDLVNDPYADHYNGLTNLLSDLEADPGEREVFEHYGELNAQEREILSYIYQTQGRNAALEWYKQNEGIYADRYYNDVRIGAASLGEEFPVLGFVMARGANLVAGAEYLTDIFNYAANGEEPYNTASLIASSADAGVMENINWQIDNWDAGDFVYSTLSSGVDSGLSMAVFGGLSGVAQGLSAAASATNDALDRGLSTKQAFWNGIAAGVFEGVFESISIGKFKALKEVPASTWKDVAKNIGRSMLVNAQEETLTEIANITYDLIANGDFSQYETAIRQYMVNGYSEKEAKSMAAQDLAKQVVEAAASGALMGFGFGVIGSAGSIAYNTASSIQSAKQTKAVAEGTMSIDGGTDALLALANDVAGVSSPATANKINNLSGKVESKATTKNVGKLYNAVANANDAQSVTDIAKSLERDGISPKEAKAMARAMVEDPIGVEKALSGLRDEVLWGKDNQSPYANQYTDIFRGYENSKSVTDAINNIVNTSKSTMGQRNQKLSGFTQSAAVAKMVSDYKARAVKAEAKAVKKGEVTTEAKSLPESHYEVSAEGKTIDSNGNDIVITGVESIENGKMILKTEGGAIDASEVAYASKDEALVYSVVADMGVSAETAWHLIKNFKASDGVSAQTYAIDIPLAYKYGKLNYKAGLKNLSLTTDQGMTAFFRGRTDAEAEVKARVKDKPAAATNATVNENSTNKEIIFEGFTYNEKTAKPLQKASVAAIDMINKMSNLEVHVYQSVKKNGKYYATVNGETRLAPNGYFTDGNKIYIDINAGNKGEGAMLYTMAHEVGHYIAEWNAEDFKAISDFLFEHYGKDVPIDKMLDAQKQKLIKSYKADGKAIPSDSVLERMAQEELVCDMLSKMLADERAFEKLMELKQKDLNLFQKLGEAIKKLLNKLKQLLNAYKDQNPDFMYAASVESFGKEAFEQLQDLYMRAFVQADANYQNSLTPGAEGTIVNENGDPVAHATEDGTVQLSMRTYEEEGRDAFHKYLEKCVSSKKLTKAEMQEMLDGIEEIYNVCKEFKDKYAPFGNWSDAAVVRDTHGKPVFSVVTPNGEYKMNLDFSLVCKKRRTLDAVFNEMSKRGIIDNFELGQKSVVKINEIIRKYGFETACALCFVDAKRFRQASMADSFTNLYNELVLSLVPESKRDSIERFNFAGYETIKKVENGIHTWDNSKLDFSHINHVLKTYESGTVEYKAAKYIKSHAEGRKLLLRGDFMSSKGFDAVKTQNPDVLKLYNSKKGTGGPKAAFGDVQYLNEVIQKARWWTPEKAYSVGGVRIQSFSDYVPRMVFDYVQMVYDLAATKLPAHAYTKEALFAKQFGLTGIKINMSLIPAIADGGIAPGLDANGDYVWAGESFDYETAKEIQNAEGYTENCGTICVGVSYEHIKKLLADPNIRMVIPYHKSGLNPIVAHMNKIAEFTDYTGNQNTLGKDGKKVEKDFDFSKALHKMGKNADPKAVADQYLKWCVANGYTPKFAEFADRDGYYKLLEDFTLYDANNQYVPQREVRAVFPTKDSAFGSMKSLIEAGLQEDAVIEGKRDKNLSAIVDEIQKTIPKTEAEIEETQVEQADRDLEAEEASYSDVMYSERVTDKETLDFLNSQKTITTYKTMQLVNGKLYPPMAARTNGVYEDHSVLGTWEQATEHPELIKNGNKYKLDKGKGQGSIEAAYNPYMHSSNLVLNDQFSGAYTRDNLVTVECEVPVSELASGYRAQYAKDSVGWHAWHTGTVAGSLRKARGIERQVFLSRWIKPVRIVPDSEVASMYKKLLDGTDIAVPDNVVTPSLLRELKKAGVKIKESGRVKYSDRDSDGNQLSEDQQEFFKDSKVRDSKGNLIVLYHGTSVFDNITEFRTKAYKSNRAVGLWLSDSHHLGALFASYMGDEYIDRNMETAEDVEIGYQKKGGVYKLYANLTNPLVVDALVTTEENFGGMVFKNYKQPFYYEIPTPEEMKSAGEKAATVSGEEIATFARSHGYDGVIIKNVKEGYGTAVTDVIAFEPNQVKYADNRTPTSSPDIRYQDRDSDSVSNRSLLANAFESVAKNDIEKQKIQEYKSKIDLINSEEQKLGELNEKIKELSFAKGPRDTKAIRNLQFEARQTANRISTYDKQLLRLEASKPLQDVLVREKKMAYQRAEKKGKEALAAYREKATKTQRALLEKWQESRKKGIESREKTAMRHKIQRVVGELNDLLLSNDKKRHVPENLKKAVADALSLVNMDTVGAEERAAKYAALIAKETDPDKIDAYTVTMENILRQGEKMGQRLKELRDAYEEIQESDDPDIANAYDPVIAGSLKELASSIGNTSLRNMSLAQLQDVYDMYKMVLTRVRDANKTFTNERNEAISNLASRVVGEVRRISGESKYRVAILDAARAFSWNNLKPVYAMERIGSNTLIDAFKNVRAGEDTWAKDVGEARAYYLDKSKKYGYDSWDFDKKYTFKSTSGLEFELSLEQIMSLYAYSKREQSLDHLRLGGFVFDSNIETYKEKDGKTGKSILKYKLNTAEAHQLSAEILANITGTLSKDQMSFVDDMQEYLSTVMGAKGNEVTMKMYGVKLFKEKFYFPLKSARQFLFEQNEVAGEVKIKNAGFTNKVVAKANNPVVLNGFMDVWADHVNDMSMYHSFVLPLEDFNRIFNYKSPKKEGQPSVSVKGTIQGAYSPAAVDYVKQLITDLNGGAMADPRETFAKAMVAKFKKAKVFASMSVVIQQPSAIGRAFALIDPKYFRPTKTGMKHKELWGELKKYAPVAVIKEMGYFDTNMGRSTRDFIKAKEYNGIKEKAKALVTDSDYRDEALSKLPALADELTWCAIWNAVKRETVATHKDLRPGSDEFLKAAGERFTEVVTKTQVYDSVLARSANMRSKSGMMSMITSFMAEPTTSINMIEDAILKAKRGDKKYAARAFASVMISVILNNALASIIYAMRDDDEDETFIEKYISAFASGMLDDLNPITYYPYLKDVWSLLQGYDVERSDMSLVSDLADAAQGIVKAYTSEDGDVAGAWWDFAGAMANIGGLPIQNIRREVKGAINSVNTIIKDVNGRQTTWGSLGDTLQATVKSATPVWGWFPDETKGDKLYDAIINGDTAYVERLKGGYKDDKAYTNAVRKALRENDPRIQAAAVARMNGDLAEYTRIVKEIVGENHFSQDDVVAAVNAEINALNKGETSSSNPKASGLYTVDDFTMAIVQGDSAMANAIKVDIIQTAQKNGKTQEEAENGFASTAKSNLKELYLTGDISENTVVDALVTYCGMDEDEAYADVRYWDFKHDNPDVYVDDAWIDEYYEEIEGSGISIDVFVDYRNRVKGITGEGKKERRMAIINSLPITNAQKDALYFAEGWTESRLYEAPWR